MLEWAVEDRGVGNVERNTVVRTTIRKVVKNFRQQKIIMIPFVVEKKMDLRKTTIALEDIQDIVLVVGNYYRFKILCNCLSSRSAMDFTIGNS